jgi:hypothetical protein
VVDPEAFVLREVERARAMLAGVVRMNGMTLQELDDTTGHARGYFSQILKGRLVLRYRHIVEALLAINMEPEHFFRLLYPPPGDGAYGAEFHRVLTGIGAIPQRRPIPEMEGDHPPRPPAKRRDGRAKRKPKKPKAT